MGYTFNDYVLHSGGESGEEMSGLDIAIIVIIVVSVLYSLFRGLVREFFSLLSLIVGFFAASSLYSFLASFLSIWIPSNLVANILSFILIFIATSLVISFIGKLVRRFVTAIHLESLDRIMGGLFGFLKGVFIVMVLVLMLVAFLPPGHPILRASRLSPYVVTLSEEILNLLPDNFERKVREKGGKHHQYRQEPPDDQRPLEEKTCSFTNRNNAFSFLRIAFA